ncbi:MAG: aldose 1-epimerase family protein [Phycisphaeraceae bacterium]
MPHTYNPHLTEHPLQLGGIRTGTLDHPQPLGSTATCVAFIDTGSGLRYTVALDRGGDIIDAVYNDTPLAYLTPNGLSKPDQAHAHGMDWLRSWAGGLMSTCGPLHIGPPNPDDPNATGLHGRHHLTPAAVTAITNPNPRQDQHDFALHLRIDHTRMFGPSLSIQRTISGTLGQPRIDITDTLTNTADTPIPQNLLYHCNLGHPLLAPGCQLITNARRLSAWGTLLNDNNPDAYKTITEPRADHAGTGEAGIILEPNAAPDGTATAGLINPHRNLALAITFNTTQLPYLAIWQHLSHAGYVTGIEPFIGSTPGPDSDGSNPHPTINPGDSKTYTLSLEVLTTPQALERFTTTDAPTT